MTCELVSQSQYHKELYVLIKSLINVNNGIKDIAMCVQLEVKLFKPVNYNNYCTGINDKCNIPILKYERMRLSICAMVISLEHSFKICKI